MLRFTVQWSSYVDVSTLLRALYSPLRLFYHFALSTLYVSNYRRKFQLSVRCAYVDSKSKFRNLRRLVWLYHVTATPLESKWLYVYRATGPREWKYSLLATTVPSQIESERKAWVICSRASLRAREQITNAFRKLEIHHTSGGSGIVEPFCERKKSMAGRKMVDANFVLRSTQSGSLFLNSLVIWLFKTF